jgi:hypothetical protein
MKTFMADILNSFALFFTQCYPTCRFCGGVELDDPEIDVCHYCKKSFEDSND